MQTATHRNPPDTHCVTIAQQFNTVTNKHSKENAALYEANGVQMEQGAGNGV
jgi:hypothetical protein